MDRRGGLFLDCTILLTFHFLVVVLFMHALLLNLLVHHITLPLRNNLCGTLTRLINLLVHLQ